MPSLIPDPKMHKIWSLTKSGVRIFSCVIGIILNSIIPIGVGMAVAEIFGIIEELV